MAKPNLPCSNPHENQASLAGVIKRQTAGHKRGIKMGEKEGKLLELGLSGSLKDNRSRKITPLVQLSISPSQHSQLPLGWPEPVAASKASVFFLSSTTMLLSFRRRGHWWGN